jgi:hypothetical protein
MSLSMKTVHRRLVWTAALGLLLSGFRTARMEVPTDLTEVAQAMDVSGSNPRRWSKPLGFGPYRTLEVDDGTEFSWSVELFGVRGGRATRKYRLLLEGPDGSTRQVECRTRSIEAWRSGWNVELTDAFEPRLACGIGDPAGESRPVRLVLASDGRRLRGGIEGSSGAFELESVHDLEGSRLALAQPAGYVVRRGTTVQAAVETLNRGRVWIVPGLDPGEAHAVAAAVAALLLYNPESTPDV